ncbi:MAG TPA: phage virion morphogenesis protein [Mesorhizobium sp.]|jgi:phage virion morphogenesis protein|uniref:phage virion morphogenesis protein n=1 Tax=Mesorhizobium sp. TaxID=1871066 RepID=UPI002DDDBA63|nr:phage virion morphogenesis protein [Mesorhizobium sp.]HEV2501615.1 phage virion morphogenesis protein [Mesorhizobium sp.]
MSGVTLETRITDHGVDQAFTSLIGLMGNTTPIMSAIGTGLVSSTHRRFISQTSPAGEAWAALNAEYKRMKRNARILTESGRLRDSISSQPGNDYVRVGTNVIYAGIHQLGGTIVPKNASHLVFRLASGVVLAKSVTLPARPYLGISDDDEEMIADTVFRFLSRFQ